MKLYRNLELEVQQKANIVIHKNLLKGKQYKCLECGKMFRDNKEPDVKYIDGDRIESEFVQACKKCFKKSMKLEKKRGWLRNAIFEHHLSKTKLKQYKNKKLSEQQLNKIVDSAFRKQNRIKFLFEQINDVDGFTQCKMYEHLKTKWKISNEDISEYALAKARKESQDEEFLND